jgi:hypothetical protein
MQESSLRFAGLIRIPKRILKITTKRSVYRFGEAITVFENNQSGPLGFTGYH